jgi:hypothetical protein
MKSEAKLQILKAGGHTYGTWKGKPIKPTQSEAHQTIENNEEEPMLPVILDDPAPDTKKKPTCTENEDVLMPPML